jgi:hypothetical protein
MVFRPLELTWGALQKGFSFMSFAFPDDSYYALLGCVYDADTKSWWVSVLFNGFYIDYEEVEDGD